MTVPTAPLLTPTPRTDAMVDSCGDYEKAASYIRRLTEFARGLERELIATGLTEVHPAGTVAGLREEVARLSAPWASFNLNQYVRVKLTDKGRTILRAQQKDLYGKHADKYPYAPPQEDAEGWSKWQLWCLMNYLGPDVCMGRDPPFETTIQFEQEPPK